MSYEESMSNKKNGLVLKISKFEDMLTCSNFEHILTIFGQFPKIQTLHGKIDN